MAGETRCSRFACCWPLTTPPARCLNALFSQEEDTRGYFLLMEGSDPAMRNAAGRLQRPTRGLEAHTGEVGRKPGGPTQFARAMEELGIRQIFARSPQAKGRVERTAGTFQDCDDESRGTSARA